MEEMVICGITGEPFMMRTQERFIPEPLISFKFLQGKCAYVNFQLKRHPCGDYCSRKMGGNPTSFGASLSE